MVHPELSACARWVQHTQLPDMTIVPVSDIVMPRRSLGGEIFPPPPGGPPGVLCRQPRSTPPVGVSAGRCPRLPRDIQLEQRGGGNKRNLALDRISNISGEKQPSHRP